MSTDTGSFPVGGEYITARVNILTVSLEVTHVHTCGSRTLRCDSPGCAGVNLRQTIRPNVVQSGDGHRRAREQPVPPVSVEQTLRCGPWSSLCCDVPATLKRVSLLGFSVLSSDKC